LVVKQAEDDSEVVSLPITDPTLILQFHAITEDHDHRGKDQYWDAYQEAVCEVAYEMGLDKLYWLNLGHGGFYSAKGEDSEDFSINVEFDENREVVIEDTETV
jgi:hypothetical protein